MINLSAGLGRYATILLFILGLGACGGGGGAGGETVPNTGEVAASSSSSSAAGLPKGRGLHAGQCCAELDGSGRQCRGGGL